MTHNEPKVAKFYANFADYYLNKAKTKEAVKL